MSPGSASVLHKVTSVLQIRRRSPALLEECHPVRWWRRCWRSCWRSAPTPRTRRRKVSNMLWTLQSQRTVTAHAPGTSPTSSLTFINTLLHYVDIIRFQSRTLSPWWHSARLLSPCCITDWWCCVTEWWCCITDWWCCVTDWWCCVTDTRLAHGRTARLGRLRVRWDVVRRWPGHHRWRVRELEVRRRQLESSRQTEPWVYEVPVSVNTRGSNGREYTKLREQKGKSILIKSLGEFPLGLGDISMRFDLRNKNLKRKNPKSEF